MRTPVKTVSKTVTKTSEARGVGRPRKEGHKKTYYLSHHAIELIALTGQKLGADGTAVVEMAVREFAAKHGISRD